MDDSKAKTGDASVTDFNPYAPPNVGPTWPQMPQTAYGAPSGYAGRFQSSGFLAVVSVGAMASQVALGFVAGVGLSLAVNVSPDVAGWIAQIVMLVAQFQGLAGLAATILFLCWVYRAAANLRALERPGVRSSPGWCVGWFFVPLMNFVAPYRIVTEIWEASGPGDVLGSRASVRTPLLIVWWGTFLVCRLLDKGGALSDDVAVLGLMSVLASIFGAVAAVCIALIMRDVVMGQRLIAASFRPGESAYYRG